MRSLGQPKVLKAAALAATVGALACYPRLLQWQARVYPLWYLEALLLLGGTVLWAFVFAWHTQCTGRPVFTLKPGWLPFGLATGLGLLAAGLLHVYVDPALRAKTPEDYPADFGQWLAMVLFSLAFTQLFLVFAPVAWLIRLFQKRAIALPLAVAFGAIVMIVKYHATPLPLSPSAHTALLVYRMAASGLLIYLYLRGGVLLVWWWCLLLQSRHLLWLI